MKPLTMLVSSKGPILSQLLLLSISMTDTFVLGFLGSEELAIGGLLNNYALLFYLLITGFSISILIVNGRNVGERFKRGFFKLRIHRVSILANGINWYGNLLECRGFN